MKLVGKYHYKEKNSFNKSLNVENIQKEVDNDVISDIKEKEVDFNLSISNINDDKTENNSKIKDLDLLDTNIFDVIEYKTEDKYTNDENEISNDCILENGNEKKIKKKKKKIIKKKKKIKRKVPKSELASLSSSTTLDLNNQEYKAKKIKKLKKKKVDLSKSFDGITQKTKSKINKLSKNIENKTIQHNNSQK